MKSGELLRVLDDAREAGRIDALRAVGHYLFHLCDAAPNDRKSIDQARAAVGHLAMHPGASLVQPDGTIREFPVEAPARRRRKRANR